MSLPLVLRRNARIEFDAAVDWYESRRLGLGALFVEHVHAAFKTISEMPELHATIYRDVRRMRVSSLPYSVFYRIRSSRVIVLAVLHDKRDPKVWQLRV
jgi:plasmid stabilization system protein ParE